MALPTHFDSLYIGGSWVKSVGGEGAAVINPATEEVIGKAPVGTAADAEAAIAAARDAFDHGPWPKMAWRERAGVLQQFHDALMTRKEEVVQLCVAEAGSIVPVASIMQFDMAMDGLQYYIHQIERREFVIPSSVSAHTNWATGGETLGSTVKVYEPLGVSVGITAYNYPFFLNLAKLGPALASGCTFILKPAPQTPLEALILGDIASEVGLPPGVFSIVTGGADVGEKLTTDPRVDQISFTGSDKIGAMIQAQAAPTLKRVTLELGGKSAMIVCEDADLEQAAFAGLINLTNQCGQGCVLQTRQLVHNAIKDQYIGMLKAMAGQVKLGNPADPDTGMGPLISAAQRERVLAFIEQGKADGNTLVCGGTIPPGMDSGFFIEPTIFDCPNNSTAIAQEEIFGPVMSVIEWDDYESMISLANGIEYGLTAMIVTDNLKLAMETADRVEAGYVWINSTGRYLGAPYGGWKQSGFGQEECFDELLSYTQIKNVNMRW